MTLTFAVSFHERFEFLPRDSHDNSRDFTYNQKSRKHHEILAIKGGIFLTANAAKKSRYLRGIFRFFTS